MEQANENLNVCTPYDEQATEPVVVVPAKDSRKFPIVPVILAGISALMSLISLIGRFSFLNLMEFSCVAVVVAGMIVSKKEKNLFAGFGFIGLVLSAMIVNIQGLRTNLSINSNYAGAVVAAILVLAIQALVWLADAGIGITYLVGKPKLAGLKIACSAIAMGIGLFTMIGSLVAMHGSGAVSLIFTFLLKTVTLYVGTILYTPFKK